MRWALVVTMTGCVEEGTDTGTTDTEETTETGTTDTSVDPPAVSVTALSPAGGDAFYSVAYDADGSFFAAGFVADSTDAAADRAMVVAKFGPDGALDDGFGEGGVARINVAVGGTNGEAARGVAVQSTGAVVLVGAIEHDVTATGTAAADRDVAVVRLKPDGTLDEGFDGDGIRILDLGTGVELTPEGGAPAWNAPDAAWSVTALPDDALLIHGATRAPDPRTDSDFVVVKLAPNGADDVAFGDLGRRLVDVGEANASARNLIVLPDGAIVGVGYANTPDFGTVQPVLYKLTDGGELDDAFGDGGVFHQEINAEFAEAYAVALQGDKLVTLGYGQRTASDTVDWLSLRLTSGGALDPSWGDAGALRLDLGGGTDNGRNALALPDDRVLFVGGGAQADGALDLAWGIVDAAGAVEPVLHDLGGPSDMGWDAAISPDGSTVAIVGLKGAGTSDLGPTNNDDAAVVRVFLR